MTQTPRTDAVIDQSSLCPDSNESCANDYASLARLSCQLEQELSAALERVRELEVSIKILEEELHQIRSDNSQFGVGA